MATQAENRQRLTSHALRVVRFRYPFLPELRFIPRNGAQNASFNALEAWVGQVMTELAQRLDQVDAAVDPDTGDGVELNEAGLIAADPGLQIEDFVRL